MNFHKACGDCIQNNQCLFQDDGDVDSCGDVGEYLNKEVEKIRDVLGDVPKWALETTLTFGKHKDETLGDIVAVDRGYLCWAEFQPFLKPEVKKAISLVLKND